MKVLFFVCCLFTAGAEAYSIRMLAKTAGQVISDRKVLIDTVIEYPKVFKTNSIGENNPKFFKESFNRLCLQAAILAENIYIDGAKVSKELVDVEYARFKKELGASRLLAFKQRYDLTSSDLWQIFKDKLLVAEIIDKRLSAFKALVSISSKSKSNAQSRLSDWFSRLRKRYPVERYEYSD